MKASWFILLILGMALNGYSQKEDNVVIIKDSIQNNSIYLAALKPSKAAFYSAIFPGLGQAYNKKYWKIPLVYGGFATTGYFFIYNNNKYHEYRDIFKEKKIDESLHPEYTLEILERAQKYHKKNRDLSLMITIGVYILQIVEASVDAHLQFHNTDNNLSISPILIQEPLSNKSRLGAGLTFNF